jgi:hypothetical protein
MGKCGLLRNIWINLKNNQTFFKYLRIVVFIQNLKKYKVMKKVIILAMFFASCVGQPIAEYNLSTRQTAKQIAHHMNIDSIVSAPISISKDGYHFEEAKKSLTFEGKTYTVPQIVEHRKWQNDDLFFDVHGNIVHEEEVIRHENAMSRYSTYGFYQNRKHLFEVTVVCTYNEVTRITAKTLVVDNVATRKSKTFKF